MMSIMMSTWHLSTWSRSGDLRLGQWEARTRSLVTNKSPLRCVISRNAKWYFPHRANYQVWIVENFRCIDPWQWRAINTGWAGGGTLISVILFAGGENWFRSGGPVTSDQGQWWGRGRVMVWRRMGGGGGERCRQGLLEPVNALLSNTKLTELSRD